MTKAPNQALPESTARFARPALPVEIQEYICHFLCSYCHDYPGLNCDRISTRALAALCRTSRSFATVAQPHVYHVASGSSSPRLLLRTLFENERLAALVRSHDQDTTYGFLRENIKIDEFTSYVEALGLSGSDVESAAPRTNGRDRVNKHLFNQLFLCLAPQLEILRLELESDQIYDEAGYQLLDARLQVICDSTSAAVEAPLSHLRTLHINTHYDWGYGLGIRTITAILQAAASSLEELIVERCTDFAGDASPLRQIQMPKLKLLAFDGCAFEHENGSHLPIIKTFCDRTSQLEEFRFSGSRPWIGENIGLHATAEDILHCVESCGQSLCTITVDLENFSDVLTPAPKLTAGSFANFSRLEVLLLDDFSFCHHMLGSQHNSLPNSCLTDLLPASIVRLIVQLSEESSVWGDLHDLAKSVTYGRFLNFRQLHLMDEHRRPRHDYNIVSESVRVASESVRVAFDSTNVTVSWKLGRSW